MTDEDIWSNVARNLSKVSLRMTATEFLEKASTEASAAVRKCQSTLRTIEQRRPEDKL